VERMKKPKLKTGDRGVLSYLDISQKGEVQDDLVINCTWREDEVEIIKKLTKEDPQWAPWNRDGLYLVKHKNGTSSVADIRYLRLDILKTMKARKNAR